MIKRSFPSISRLGIGAAIASVDTPAVDTPAPVESKGGTYLLAGLGIALVGLVGWGLWSDYKNVQSLTPTDRADLMKKRALYGFGNEAIRDLSD